MKVLRFKSDNSRRRHRGRLSLPQLRAWEIEKIIRYRREHGAAVEPAAYLQPMAHTYREIVGSEVASVAAQLVSWARVHDFAFAPEQIQRAAEVAVHHPRRLSADGLGWSLHLSYADRRHMGIKSIGSFDVNKAERKRRREQQYNDQRREAFARERARRGGMTRAEYLAASKSQQEPWKAEGVSRRTWYRRRAADGPVAQVIAAVKKERKSLIGLARQPVPAPPESAARQLKWLPMKTSAFRPHTPSPWLDVSRSAERWVTCLTPGFVPSILQVSS